MEIASRLGLAIGVVTCCAACGGGGGGGGGGGTNPYAGSYVGEFVDQNGVTGQFDITVASNVAGNNITGAYLYTNNTINFTGAINKQGHGDFTTSAGTTGIQFGQLAQPTTSLSINSINNPGALVVLISNPTGLFGGANSFSGDYAGTVQNTTINKTGVIALSISSSGVVSGSDVVEVNGTPTLTTVSGTLSTAGALNYQIAANGVTVTGNVSLSNGTISGALTSSDGDALSVSITQVQPL